MDILVCDIETEKLHNPEKIWCAVTKELDKEPKVWTNLHDKQKQKDFRTYIQSFLLVFHNGIGFDIGVLNRICDLAISPTNTIDTLVCSRLFNSWDYNSHGLEDWGERLGYPKIKFKDFSQLSDEMIEYCIRDVEITEKLYKLFESRIMDKQWHQALALEHESAAFCNTMRENGFGFDYEGCRRLQDTIRDEVHAIDTELQTAFRPKSKRIREVCPRATKSGKLHAGDFRWLDKEPSSCGYSPNAPFSLFEWEEFNPGSVKQIVDRMWEAGWKPVEKTKGHILAERNKDHEKLRDYARYGWKVSETNLETLPPSAPDAAKKLVRHILLTRRISTLQEWLDAYNSKTKSIHGTIHSVGTWTHRASHSNPNQGNIPRSSTPFGHEMRSLWGARSGRLLVGVDADQIQYRVLAHLINDPKMINALETGNKELKTDLHNKNANLLGCSRDTAKTFIYAYLLGGAGPRLAQILDSDVGYAIDRKGVFEREYPTLIDFKQGQCKEDAERGYFIGLDGRKVKCDSAHKMLAGYLQNGEAVLMKKAQSIWTRKLDKEKVPYWPVDWVHDEWQTETPEDEQIAEYVKQVQCWAIEKAGEDFNMRIKLAGEGSIGHNWSQTH